MKFLSINFENSKYNLTKKANVLYLNCSGLLELLVRSKIIFYNCSLSVHYSNTLLTNEIIK
jgi:hypothetical protein